MSGAAAKAPEAEALVRRLAGMVPRDARVMLELRNGAPSIAGVFAIWNPQARVVSVPLDDPAAAARLAAPGPDERFDAVLLHAGTAAPAALAGAARSLAPHGVLVAVFGRGSDVPEDRDAALATVQARLAAVGIVPDQAWTPAIDGVPPVVIVRAVPAGAPLRRILVQALTVRPAGAVNDKRIHEPNEFLVTLPGMAALSRVNDIDLRAAEGSGRAPIALMHRRVATTADLPTYKELVRRGYLLVAEFDDHPLHWPVIEQHGNIPFRAVHAVQTSTEPLAALFRGFNPEVMVFPNQIARLPPRRARRTGPGVTLFAGAFNRDAEWKELAAPLVRLIERFGDRVAVEVVHDRTLFDALPTARKRFTPTCDYPTYLRVLAQCDVALLPLQDTLFNRCKSDLKFIEGAAFQAACLASPVVYADTVADGVTGLLFDGPAAFEEKLAFLIENAEAREDIIDRAYAYVRENRLLAQDLRRRHDWYCDLLARKPELDAKLFERYPILRP
jgi:hypothetical protein